MLTDEQGVKAIIFLQRLIGVDESAEVALKNWQKMPKQEKEQTEIVFRMFYTFIEAREESCKQN